MPFSPTARNKGEICLSESHFAACARSRCSYSIGTAFTKICPAFESTPVVASLPGFLRVTEHAELLSSHQGSSQSCETSGSQDCWPPSGQAKKNLTVWECSVIGRVLAQRALSPWFTPQHHTSRAERCTPVTPAVQRRQGDQKLKVTFGSVVSKRLI